MSVTFLNETTDYRSARAVLLEREVALRRQMEAVATALRALPPGGEVPEDYLFDCIGPGDAPSKVRLSDLFRSGDTLMLYHYMFPRHGQDNRPGPTVGDGSTRLHWASELLFEPADPGQDPRHMGTVEPLWTLFDLTPGGRPNADEQIEYGCCS